MKKNLLIYKKIYKNKEENTFLKKLFFLSVFLFIISFSLFFINKFPFIKIINNNPKKNYLTCQVENEFKHKIDNYQKNNSSIKIIYTKDNPDIVIDVNNNSYKNYQKILIKKEKGTVIKFLNQQKIIDKEKEYYLFFKEKNKLIDDLLNYLKNDNQQLPEISFNAVGDIIPGRTVAKKMAVYGYNYPFEKVASSLKNADIVYGNLECPLSDRIPPPYEGMNFLAPSATIEGLKNCGINVVSLANNHSTNFGSEVFLDTLKILKENKINYFGGGKDKKEAKNPLFLDIKGIRFAFLNYNSIIGGIEAEDNNFGVNWVHIKPWSEVDNELEIQEIEKEIRKAKEKADIVVVCFHWGVEYQLEPIDSQIKLAHRAIDNGASLIIGTHPHVVQPIEYYQSEKNKEMKGFIFYSLGNFVFDQMWSEETREGIIVKMNFSGKKLTTINLIPYKIEDYCQPNILDDNEGRKIIDKIISHSKL